MEPNFPGDIKEGRKFIVEILVETYITNKKRVEVMESDNHEKEWKTYRDLYKKLSKNKGDIYDYRYKSCLNLLGEYKEIKSEPGHFK